MGRTHSCQKPKGISSDLSVTGQWAAVIRRIMNGTGVIKVYLIQSKRYAYRLRFVRARAPERVLEALKEINPHASIGFEDDNTMDENCLGRMAEEIENQKCTVVDVEEIESIDPDNEVNLIGNDERQTVVLQSIKSVEEAWDDTKVKHEETEERMEAESQTLHLPPQRSEQGVYITRSGRISRPPDRFIEMAYAVIAETYKQNFYEDADNFEHAVVECTLSMKALLFQRALEQKPEEAMKALREEVMKAIKIDIWEPVHPEVLSEEEQKLIIPQMMNYLEKFKPDDTFDKYKVRVLTRGDKQVFTGESEGPVAKVESLLMLLAIAAHQDLAIFKIDIGSAFMRTPMAEDVKHKWVRLDKRVV
jgi:hypothetical protein